LAERLATRDGTRWVRDIAIAVAVGLVVTAFVIWRDSRRADVTFTIGAVPPTTVTTAIELTGVPRRSFVLPRLPRDAPGEVMVHIATYLQPATATVRLAVVDAAGRTQARCTFPPSAYHDNALITCDVPSLARARRLVVTHAGPAKLAVFGNEARKRTPAVVGLLAFRNPHDTIGRMRTAIDRVGVSLPAGLGPTVLIGGLWLWLSAAVLALLVAVGIAREGADPLFEQREPLGEPAGVLAEPRDDEREVEHDGEEEAERDHEQGVGRRGDANRTGDAGEQGGPGGEDQQGQPGRQPEH
jgi:hypothetical protein